MEDLPKHPFTEESALIVQMFSGSPLTSPCCPAWEWVGIGIGCHLSSSPSALGPQVRSVSHENKAALLSVVSERKHVDISSQPCTRERC